jgi:hypothetical protein
MCLATAILNFLLVFSLLYLFLQLLQHPRCHFGVFFELIAPIFGDYRIETVLYGMLSAFIA